ncbi:MAG: gas vesicle protein [Anaerolineae bacterium]|nr:gas vesicle protein [Anaerolineae bacterium]
MEATRVRQATIDDLLERVLDKGIILNLDLVIGVAGIPLIGINLRAAIASIETMIEYGIMQAWDEELRQYAARELQRKKLALAPGEAILLDMFGSHWYSDGIYRAWRPGRLYLTDRRLILYRREPAEVLFQTPLAEIQDLMVNEETYFTGIQRDLLYLSLATGEVASLYAEDIGGLKEALEEKMAATGRVPAGDFIPFLRDREVGVVIKERTVADGKMWYQVPNAGIHGPTWRSGWLYLTVQRLLWWSDFDRRVGLEIPLGKIRGISLGTRDLGGFLHNREVLTIVYGNHQGQEEALFSGEVLTQWRRQIKEQVLDYGDDFHA